MYPVTLPPCQIFYQLYFFSVQGGIIPQNFLYIASCHLQIKVDLFLPNSYAFLFSPFAPSSIGDSTYLYPALRRRERLESFSVKYNVSCEFFVDAFYQTGGVSFSPNLLTAFIVKGCERILSDTFFTCIKTIMWFLSFVDMIRHYIYWFLCFELALHSWGKQQLIVMYNSFPCCWIWLLVF